MGVLPTRLAAGGVGGSASAVRALLGRCLERWRGLPRRGRRGRITFHQLGNYGRLGNQLFQYAALRSLAVRTRRTLILPPAHEHRLTAFRIVAPCSAAVGTPRMPNEFRETQYHFDASFFSAPSECNVLGYFQSERYFAEIADQVRSEFTLADARIARRARAQLAAVRARFPGRPVVALHNRRGDYVPTAGEVLECKHRGAYRPDKARYHPLLNSAYIEGAMRLFDGCCFLVFSDTEADRAWCREHLGREGVSVVEGNDDLTDFELQRLCDHNIIANSTFSWWAAWLNPSPARRVVAPRHWFGEVFAHQRLDDLIPAGWTRL